MLNLPNATFYQVYLLTVSRILLTYKQSLQIKTEVKISYYKWLWCPMLPTLVRFLTILALRVKSHKFFNKGKLNPSQTSGNTRQNIPKIKSLCFTQENELGFSCRPTPPSLSPSLSFCHSLVRASAMAGQRELYVGIYAACEKWREGPSHSKRNVTPTRGSYQSFWSTPSDPRPDNPNIPASFHVCVLELALCPIAALSSSSSSRATLVPIRGKVLRIRFAQAIEKTPGGAVILDFSCNQGHWTCMR